jgi:preprotein translocase subunit SecG
MFILATFLSTSLTIVLCIISLLVILCVVIQKPRQEGLGASFGDGMTSQIFGAQTTSALQKITWYLAGFFALVALILAWMVSHQQSELRNKKTISSQIAVPASETAPVTPNAVGTPVPAEVQQEVKKVAESVAAEVKKLEAPAVEEIKKVEEKVAEAIKPVESVVNKAAEAVVPTPAPTEPVKK